MAPSCGIEENHQESSAKKKTYERSKIHFRVVYSHFTEKTHPTLPWASVNNLERYGFEVIYIKTNKTKFRKQKSL